MGKFDYDSFRDKCLEWEQMNGAFHRLEDIALFFGFNGLLPRIKEGQKHLTENKEGYRTEYALIASELYDLIGQNYGRPIQILTPLPHFFPFLTTRPMRFLTTKGAIEKAYKKYKCLQNEDFYIDYDEKHNCITLRWHTFMDAYIDLRKVWQVARFLRKYTLIPIYNSFEPMDI